MKHHFISLERAPFIRILIPFIAGILIRFYFPSTSACTIPLLLLFAAGAFLFQQAPAYIKFKYGWWQLLCWQGQILLFGMLLVWLRDERRSAWWMGTHLSQAHSLIVTITETPEKKGNQWVISSETRQLVLPDSILPAVGKLKMYIKQDSADTALRYGDRLLIRNNVKPILSGSNPGAFNYGEYAANQRLYYQANLFSGDWKILDRAATHPMDHWLHDLRQYILQTLRTHIYPEEATGIAEALLLGYKQDLDREMLQAYSRTGVVHIIAVSGMHLGIIYWLLTVLCRPLRRWKKGVALESIVVLTGLWIFSLLAGAGPSVLRSAVMFSCITIGNSFGLRSATYNSLSASAFLLLCFEPHWIFDVGFQLSYTAVASIIYFQPILQTYFYSPYKVVDLIGQLISVTLSAQVLTLPLCLYHFHQFPVLFLVTNLIAVPYSSAVLLLIIPLPLLHLLPVVAGLWGKLIGVLIQGMNRVISFADSLPFAVWEGLQLSAPQVILLYIFIIALCRWLIHASGKGKWIAALSLLCMAVLRTQSFLSAADNRQLIIYNISRQSAASIWNGRTVWVFHSDSIRRMDKVWIQQIRPSFTLYRAASVQNRSVIPEYIQIREGFNIYSPLGLPPDSPGLRKHPPDLIWLRQNPRVSVRQLASLMEIKQVVVDGSNSFRNREEWEKECRELNISIHRTDLSGAFVKKR